MNTFPLKPFSKVTSDKSADIVAFGRMDAKEAPAADREYAVTLDVEVAPEFKLPEYKGLEIKVEDGETLEQHIENRMKYLKDLYADYVTIEEPAQKGDMLKVSYESDFVPAEDAPASLRRAVKSEESWIWLSEPEQIPGVLAALTGAKKDGEYTFKAEFPADWREKDLQGKSVEYKVKVFEAQRRVPVADDAKLAEKLGLGTVEKMNEEIRKTAERELEQMHKEAVKAKAAETIVGMVEDFPLPKGILASASQREFSRIAERLVRSEAREISEEVLHPPQDRRKRKDHGRGSGSGHPDPQYEQLSRIQGKGRPQNARRKRRLRGNSGRHPDGQGDRLHRLPGKGLRIRFPATTLKGTAYDAQFNDHPHGGGTDRQRGTRI